MKIISWNIDSINAALTSDSARAVLSRDVLSTIREEEPDIIAIQETKLSEGGLTATHQEVLEGFFPGFQVAFVSSRPPAKKGYAGTMFLYRKDLSPEVIIPSLSAPEPMDLEGRLLTLEFPDFYLVNVYTPNAGDGLKRLTERMEWDRLYSEYLHGLDQEKPVIACGDFNVAHEEIDLANPDANHRSAGFTDEEREGFRHLLSYGFVDTFRHLHGPVPHVYSWWAQRIKTSKINNSGWRIDYFLVSERVLDAVSRSEMLDSGERQDHTPLVFEIDL